MNNNNNAWRDVRRGGSRGEGGLGGVEERGVGTERARYKERRGNLGTH